ncbi:EthD domain-containing protein [Pseudonocardia sp.]|uniref:EthD domain-containing protein n=1 Tax=Pseudonocardia sp. TaxID=60912 RepID=UPI003D12F1A0
MTADTSVPAAPSTPSTAAPALPRHDAMTLVIPLKAKDGMTPADFYDYWLNAHVTLPPRFPGLRSVWLHKVALEDSLWPAVDGVSMRPDEQDTFHGVPEATFATMADLQAFVGASRVQMEDGINFLSQEIGYAALGPNSETVRDAIDPAPDGTDGHVRHLVFLRMRPGSSVAGFREWVDGTLVPTLAAAPEIVKLRRHLFEELDITLDHPGVEMTKPPERQYQAMVEVVVGDEAAFARFTGSPAHAAAARVLAQRCAAVHPARVQRCITTKHDGRITLAGVRGVAVADLIRRLGARSQTFDDVSREFLPPADLVRG